jgi:CheY-like chemotaxis protein
VRTLLSDSESRLRVLVVDDEPVMAGMTALLVAMVGYEAIQCHSPREAIERIKSEPVDLLLSDYEMPSMNGLELVTQLRKDGYAFPVVIMSGQIGAVDLNRAERLGVLMVLEKPFGLREIQATLRAILK